MKYILYRHIAYEDSLFNRIHISNTLAMVSLWIIAQLAAAHSGADKII